MPHEDSNRAFLIQSQASYQIDDGAKISAGNSLVRRRIASLLVDHMGIEPIDESLARRLRYPIDMARKLTGSHVLNRMLSSITTFIIEHFTLSVRVSRSKWCLSRNTKIGKSNIGLYFIDWAVCSFNPAGYGSVPHKGRLRHSLTWCVKKGSNLQHRYLS